MEILECLNESKFLRKNLPLTVDCWAVHLVILLTNYGYNNLIIYFYSSYLVKGVTV